MPFSVDEMENINNNCLKPIPKIDRSTTRLLGSLDNQERRIVNRGENHVYDGKGYNELTSNDLQDFIDKQLDLY